MSKQNSSKKKEKCEEPLSLTAKNSFLDKKKRGNEIDEIFSAKKRKKPDQQKTDTGKENENEKPKLTKEKKKKKKKQSDDVDAPARPRKKTEDGFTIYTETELGISNPNAGGTALCPFDCDCCF